MSVDDELELGGLLDGQVHWLGSLKDLFDVVRRPATQLGKASSFGIGLGIFLPGRYQDAGTTAAHIHTASSPYRPEVRAPQRRWAR